MTRWLYSPGESASDGRNQSKLCYVCCGLDIYSARARIFHAWSSVCLSDTTSGPEDIGFGISSSLYIHVLAGHAFYWDEHPLSPPLTLPLILVIMPFLTLSRTVDWTVASAGNNMSSPYDMSRTNTFDSAGYIFSDRAQSCPSRTHSMTGQETSIPGPCSMLHTETYPSGSRMFVGVGLAPFGPCTYPPGHL